MDEPRTRPRDRRATILLVASAEFHRRGYAGTSLDDIAVRLGITAPALYRHFRGKEALYEAVLDRHLRELEQVVAGASSPQEVGLGLAETAVDHPALGLLWNPDRRRRLRDAAGELDGRLGRVTDALAALLDGIGDGRGPVRARAALAAASSTGFYASPLDREEQVRNLERAIGAVAGFRPQGALERVAQGGDKAPRPWETRRTALLDACAALVTERGGSAAVTIEEIGAAARIPPATVYQLFESKAALLAAVLARAANGAMAVLLRASAEASTAEDALDRVVASSAALSAEHPSWGAVLSDEVSNLPDGLRQRISETVEEYLDEWLALCGAISPDLSQDALRVRMRAALGVLDDRGSRGTEVEVLGVADTAALFRRMLTA